MQASREEVFALEVCFKRLFLTHVKWQISNCRDGGAKRTFNDYPVWIEENVFSGCRLLKWFFLACFIAAILLTIFWCVIFGYTIRTNPLGRSIMTLSPALLFSVWGARMTYRSYKEEKAKDKSF